MCHIGVEPFAGLAFRIAINLGRFSPIFLMFWVAVRSDIVCVRGFFIIIEVDEF